MLKFLTFSVVSLLAALLPLQAQGEDFCDQSEAGCILEAAWGAALILPMEKQDRVRPLFVQLAREAGGAELEQKWAAKLRVAAPSVQAGGYEDFGWVRAEPVLTAHGVQGLIRYAREKREPLGLGRGDALLAAGKRLYATRADEARLLNQALLDLARTASSFERPELAHAAAELAMHRCDLASFDRASGMVLAAGSLRYALWRARITGGARALTGRIRAEADSEDTRHVRQVLDGYGAIVRLGYCA